MLIHGHNCYTTVEHQDILKLEIPTSYFTSFPKVMHFYMRAPTLQKIKIKINTIQLSRIMHFRIHEWVDAARVYIWAYTFFVKKENVKKEWQNLLRDYLLRCIGWACNINHFSEASPVLRIRSIVQPVLTYPLSMTATPQLRIRWDRAPRPVVFWHFGFISPVFVGSSRSTSDAPCMLDCWYCSSSSVVRVVSAR